MDSCSSSPNINTTHLANLFMHRGDFLKSDIEMFNFLALGRFLFSIFIQWPLYVIMVNDATDCQMKCCILVLYMNGKCSIQLDSCLT